MEIYPAVDILDGRCVRLRQGDFADVEVFSDDPVATAKKWHRADADRIHLIDLDGAREGASSTLEIVRKMLEIGIELQVGGGIRDEQTAERLLRAGVQQIIVGTWAVQSPRQVGELAQKWPGRVAAACDCRDGELAVKGWQVQSTKTAEDFAKTMREVGIERIIVTDISSDGMMNGPDLNLTESVLQQQVEVVVSGGVSTLQDIAALQQMKCTYPNLVGVILGRALYNGSLSLKEVVGFVRDGERKEEE